MLISWFGSQRWGEFLISRLSPIEFGTASFEHLVIPDSYRRIIQALVTVHASELKDGLIQDVIKGKGTGLIMALHGTPGTGKVSTGFPVRAGLSRTEPDYPVVLTTDADS